MAIPDTYRREMQEATEWLEQNPLTMLRACVVGDPVTFAELVLIAVGPLQASQVSESPSDAELRWIARELLAALRGEDDNGMRAPGRLN
jgi:hypothetical protein